MTRAEQDRKAAEEASVAYITRTMGHVQEPNPSTIWIDLMRVAHQVGFCEGCEHERKRVLAAYLGESE